MPGSARTRLAIRLSRARPRARGSSLRGEVDVRSRAVVLGVDEVLEHIEIRPLHLHEREAVLLAQTVAVARPAHDAAHAAASRARCRERVESSGSKSAAAARPAAGRVQVQVARLARAGVAEAVHEQRRRRDARSRRQAHGLVAEPQLDLPASAKKTSVCARCVCGRAPSSPAASDHSSQSSCGSEDLLVAVRQRPRPSAATPRAAREPQPRDRRRRGSRARRRCLRAPAAATSSTVSASMPPIANHGTRSVSRAARTSASPPAAASGFVGVP